MKFTYQLKGYKELAATLRAVAVAVQQDTRIAQAAMIPAEAIAADARGLAPYKTGNLRNHIDVRQTRRGALVGVTGVPYAPFVEYGTSRMPAQPFLRPAVAAVEPTALDMMAPGVDEVIQSTTDANAAHYKK